VTAANTDKTLVTGAAALIYTAPTDGALVTGILAMPLGTNVASVARLFLNNGGVLTTASNNAMISQISLPATTNTEVAALTPLWIPIPRLMQDLKATYRLYITIGTAVAAGWQFTAAASRWATV
jgi:hypothetical protein